MLTVKTVKMFGAEGKQDANGKWISKSTLPLTVTQKESDCDTVYHVSVLGCRWTLCKIKQETANGGIRFGIDVTAFEGVVKAQNEQYDAVSAKGLEVMQRNSLAYVEKRLNNISFEKFEEQFKAAKAIAETELNKVETLTKKRKSTIKSIEKAQEKKKNIEEALKEAKEKELEDARAKADAIKQALLNKKNSSKVA